MDRKAFLITVLSNNDVTSSVKTNLDTLLSIIPELRGLVGFEHRHPHHHLDVWEHTLLALSYSDNEIKTRVALLLHDVGKPHSYSEEDDGTRHFHGHPRKSRDIAFTVLNRLGFDESFTRDVCDIIEKHDTPIREEEMLLNRAFTEELFKVQRCDALAHNPTYNKKRLEYIEKISKLLEK